MCYSDINKKLGTHNYGRLLIVESTEKSESGNRRLLQKEPSRWL